MDFIEKNKSLIVKAAIGILIGLVLGLLDVPEWLIGAIVAVAIIPASKVGEEKFDEMWAKSEDARERAGDLAEDARERAGAAYEKVKDKAEDAFQADDKTDDAQVKKSDNGVKRSNNEPPRTS